jgi:nucleoside-diphosphate-sugar epimerase
VTGASGFVGTALLPVLALRGHAVRAAARRPLAAPGSVVVPEVGPDTDWRTALAGCDAVVHLAARVHVMRDEVRDPLEAYRRVNAAGTARLARQAVEAGVGRFVFVSTAKVLGEHSPAGHPFTDDDAPSPADPYSMSKAEAEDALERMAAGNGMRAVMLRPPLVYGPGVGANFLRLMDAIARGRPLPVGLVANRRSLVYVGNLVAAIAAGLELPTPPVRCLVSDGEDVSTPDLARRIASALDTRARLLPIPPGLLSAAGALTGRRAEVDRLLGNFALAPTALARAGWTPPFTLDQGLVATAAWFRSRAG